MSDGKKPLKIKDQVKALETQVEKLHNANLALATQVENLRVSTLYLQDRLEAVVALSEREEPMTKEGVEQEVINSNIVKLKSEVQQAVDQGALERVDMISHRSFVVAKETDKKTGKIVQPRVQVSMMSMPNEVQDDFVGKSVGDVIEKDDALIEVQEIYDIKDLGSEE